MWIVLEPGLQERIALVGEGADLPVVGVIMFAIAALLVAVLAVVFIIPALIFVLKLMLILFIVALECSAASCSGAHGLWRLVWTERATVASGR